MKNNEQIKNLGQWYLETRLLSSELNDLCRQHEMSFEQFLFLEQIVEFGPQSPSELAIKFSTSGPIATRKLNALYRRKMIEKSRGTRSDQRVVNISITSIGNAVYEQIAADLMAWCERQKRTQVKTYDKYFLVG